MKNSFDVFLTYPNDFSRIFVIVQNFISNWWWMPQRLLKINLHWLIYINYGFLYVIKNKCWSMMVIWKSTRADIFLTHQVTHLKNITQKSHVDKCVIFFIKKLANKTKCSNWSSQKLKSFSINSLNIPNFTKPKCITFKENNTQNLTQKPSKINTLIKVNSKSIKNIRPYCVSYPWELPLNYLLK